MSDSESDSEGEKIRRTKRKVVVKFEFDDSESSQSDSDVSMSMQPARTSRRRRKLTSSEEEADPQQPESSNVRPRRSGSGAATQNSQTFYDDDESSDSSWCPETAGPSSIPNARNMPKKVATQCEMEPDKDEHSDTSSDDASNEKCPICLHSFREQEIGTPNICEHSFCAPCIEEWSKNVQTCPIDRKAFSYIIVRDRYENGKMVREIKVVAQSTTLLVEDDDSDMTLCEICGHGDREDRMLLCDDCNLGYHMDCLNPPLNDVPTGSWYCDNCFASEQSSGEDDIHQLIEELETEIGMPETRLRVRRVDDQPRITRTRQSERIRASIISRIAPSRRHAPVSQEESPLGMILPGPSRIRTTTTTTTTTTTRTSRRLTGRRKKRRKRKRRTYVVEYDVNNFDEKFSIETTRKVLKRRRRRRVATKPKIRTVKRKRAAGSRCSRSTNRNAANLEATASATKLGVERPIDAVFPKLHLFGNDNALEYFSDDDGSSNEFEEHSGHGLSGAAGSSLLATALTRTRIVGNSSLRRRKRIVSALDANPASVDSINILSNIMDTMDRLNPVVRPNESIKKDEDFKKKIEKPDKKQPESDDTTNSDVLHAPMYPGGGSSGGYNNNRYQNNDQSFRNNSRNSSGGTSNNTSNTSSNNNSSSGGGGTSMSFSIFGPRPTFPSTGPVGNNCGNTGPATNNFPSRFPATPPNRTPRPQFRPRTPFNQTPPPQRFSPRNFNNRFLRPNESPNIEVPQQGLYDDVEMPSNSQDIRVPNSQTPQTPSLLDMRIPNPNSNIPDMRTPPQHAPQRDFQLNHRMSEPPPHLPSPMNMQQHHMNPTTRPPMQQQTFVNTMHELPPPQSPRMQHLPPPPRPTMASALCMQTPPPPIPPIMLHTPTHMMPPPIMPQIPFGNSQMYGPDVQNPIQVLGCMPPPKNFNANQSFNNFNQNNENQNETGVNTDENIRQSNLIPIAAEDIPLPIGGEGHATSQNSTLRGLAEYSGSEDEDDCPNMLVYSAESLNMAKQPDAMDAPLVFGPINRPCNEHEMERDEDLVQMDDDDEDEVDDEEEEEEPVDANAGKASSQNVDKDESKVTASSGKKNVLELYDDSDWEEYNVKNDEDKTKAESNDKNDDNSENNNVEQADERSYTPCLDEQFQLSGEGDKSKETNEDLDDGDEADKSSIAGDDDKDKNDGNESQRRNSMSGIGGMETELISDDDDEDILSKGQNGADEGAKGGSNRSGKKTADKKRDTKSNEDGKEKNRRKKDDSFKKISRSNKDRNYRDKKFDTKRRSRRNRSRSRSRSRSRTRSRSNNKENRRFYKRDKFRRRDTKRKDIERYDVRHVIAERQPRTFKDKYGRDTSRPPRSRSPSLTRSRKRTKSPSRTRRSRSIVSVSPRIPPSRRRSLSRVRSISRGRRRSLSRPIRRISHTPPPSLRRRSRTPIRSRSRSRPLNGRQIRSNSMSPRQFNRPMSRQPSASPVRSKVRTKNRRKDGEKKTIKRKAKKRLKCPEPAKKAATMATMTSVRSRSKSWENANRLSPWSRSPTPLRIDEPNNDHSWTPPIVAAEAENLTVILKNKDAKRKKEKKKRTEKRREALQKRERRKLRNEKPAPSKEVFASGDNILVSVSFNKEVNKAPQTTIVTLPPTKEQILPKKPSERDTVTKRSKRGPRKHKKITAKPVAIIDLDRSPFKEITPSPKAVIVLSDSDHEDNNNTDKPDRPTVPVSDNEVTSSNMGNRGMDTQSELISQPQSPTMDDLSFENTTLGPKTPPEPSSIVKFSLPIKMKNKLRVVNNPLHEIHDDETSNDKQIEESTLNASDSSQQQNKVGPNTPPESACSPDAYDPFEPTKSPSQSPENRSDNCDSSPNDMDDSHTNKSDISTNQEDKLQQQQQQQQQQQEKSVKPVDLTIALINSKASMDAAHSLLSSTLEGGVNESEIIDDDVQILSPNDESDDIPKPQTINVISNVLLSHPKDSIRQRSGGLALPTFSSSAISPAKTTASSSTPKQSPMKPKFSSASLITKLPLPKPSKPLAASRHNGGNDENMDVDPSPYSPDSSDYDDLFEPPNASPPPTHQKKNKAGKVSGGKAEVFEDLFGSTSPVANKASGRSKKQRSKKSSIKEWLSDSKKTAGSSFAKMTDDQIRILDDLPSSAVDLQVKDKFLRKIHRQERVVEEVKLVLKPHYNKKHITKDDYKDILRRAVPKICHNRTGEINPKKIHALIEAYVKKFRHRRKATSTSVK